MLIGSLRSSLIVTSVLRSGFGLICIAFLSAWPDSAYAGHVPVPTGCATDVDGCNDEPGQKDLSQYCAESGDGSPYELVTLANWDETTLTGNNTADICTLFDTDGNGFADIAACTTLESSGAGNGNLVILADERLYTCGNDRADRCTGSVLVPGPYTSLCEVSQEPTDPCPPGSPGGLGDEFPDDTQVTCGIDLADFGVAGSGATLLDICSYPSQQPNSDPSDCLRFIGCSSDAECDDGNECTTGTCDTVSGVCVQTPNTGQVCSDGEFCNGDEFCNDQGFCPPSTVPRDCNDSVGCTTDTCDELLDQCVNTPVDSVCADGTFCNGVEICDPINDCQPGTPVDCDDGVSCTVDVCNEGTQSCDNTPDDGLCDNGDYCDGAETCDPALGCQPGTAPDCDDGVGCTIDTCNETTDSCDNTPNDASCNDGVFCDGVETCDPLTDCQAGTPPSCDDGVACTDDSCNVATDSCDNIANDGNCDDGAYCNGAETCDPVNDCQAGTPPNCNDGVGCTDDSCNEATDSCDNVANDANCDDLAYCNGVETCDPVNDCQAGTPLNCDDGVGCTEDSCNEATDSCDNIANDALCNDGEFCNGEETCDPVNDCQNGTPPNCDDGVGCTDDSCNEVTDQCDNIPNNGNCDDGLFCNGVEICDPVNGCQIGTDPCSGGTICDEPNDRCINCLVDADCDNNVFCDGAETCNTVTGECEADTPVDCDDGVDCTVDTCNEGTDQCDNVASDAFCDDGAFCNGVETCDPLNDCQAGTAPNCDDGVGCTDDSCNEATDQCDNIANDANCDNGQFCDGAETCDPLLDCQDGADPNCDDDVGCTDDSCNEATDQCDNIANDANCENGQFCDGLETCDPLGDCQNGTPPNCDDGQFCTADSCNEVADQCDNIDDGSVCGAGFDCNEVDDVCELLPFCPTADCDDDVACTDDSCDELNRVCVNAPNDANCDNGLFCDGAETCDPVGDCQPGFPVECNTDGFVCTVEECNEDTDQCDPVDFSACICGDGETVPDIGEQCDPPDIAGQEDCNDGLDNDGDGRIDCRDIDCAPLGTPGRPVDARPAVVCDNDCQEDILCTVFEKDPGRIKYGRNGKHDKFSLHGRFLLQVDPDPAVEGLSFELSNEVKPIYRAFLGLNDLQSNAKGTRYKFKDKDARVLGGASANGGLYRVALKRRTFDGAPYMTFRIKAYGDFHSARRILMATQLAIGGAVGNLEAEWIPSNSGWKLPLRNF